MIRAFNKDMPYNQFLRLQLAGDLIPEPTTDYVDASAGWDFRDWGRDFAKGPPGRPRQKLTKWKTGSIRFREACWR